MYKNIVWDLIGKFGIQIVSFCISIILTRLLSPAEYGIMGMAMVIVTFAHVFLDLGFNRAIIQQPKVTQLQYSTIFYINAGIALILTFICFLLARPLALFYKQPLISPVFRVVSLSFLLNGLNLVPSSILYKKMNFKVNSIQSLISALVSGGLGVFMAYKGYGIWSLVVQSLTGSAILLVLNFAYVRWYPQLGFSFRSIRKMWKYGSRLFASGVLDTLYSRLDTFIIGKIFPAMTLGFYTRAQGMDNMVRQFSAGAIVGALFPQIAKYQHDRQYLKDLFVKYLHVIMFTSVGISGILFLIAKDLFTILFTARWNEAAELFQIMAVAGFAYPVSNLMCSIISGVGNSKAFLKLEVIKRLILLPVYIFGFLCGLKGFIILFLCVGMLGVVLNGMYTAKEIAVPLRRQGIIILSYFLVGLIASFISYVLLRKFPSDILILRIGLYTLTFSGLYISGAYAVRLNGTEVITFGAQKIKTFFQ